MENGAVASGQYRLKGEEGEELYRFSTENGCVKQEDYVPDYPAEDWVFTLEEMAAMAGDVIKWVPDNLSEIKDGFYIDNIDPKFVFLTPAGGTATEETAPAYVYSLSTKEITPSAGEYAGSKEYGGFVICNESGSVRVTCYIDD